MLNGAAKCLGGVIKDKRRSMAISSKLSYNLWLEINCSVVYFYNYILRYKLNWKISYEVFYTYLAL